MVSRFITSPFALDSVFHSDETANPLPGMEVFMLQVDDRSEELVNTACQSTLYGEQAIAVVMIPAGSGRRLVD
jgi:hypothetical protein